MTRVQCGVVEPFSSNFVEPAAYAARDFSPDAEKFAKQALVVDDEPLIRWSVSESLAGLGFDVTEAPDAVTALKMVTTSPLPFDIVVLDLRLPDMHDLSLLGTLRQIAPAARVLLMTAFGTPEVIAEARSLGATVLSKPFALEELNRLVLNG